MTCIYWVAMTMTTGESLAVPPSNQSEVLFVIVNVLLGMSLFATIVGNIGALVAEKGQKRAQFHDWFHRTRELMRKRQIPAELYERICAWFQHYWIDNRAIGMLPLRNPHEL